ncbi:MAG: FaeA/PapI family transcriptional regulator [Methanothrix sp.]
MASYQEKILEVIGESNMGLTTVDVAKRAGVSKTTVIKYLSVLSSEGSVEFVEVGPSKLWRIKGQGIKAAEEVEKPSKAGALPTLEIDFCDDQPGALCFSFKVDPEQICALMKRANLCMHKAAET